MSGATWVRVGQVLGGGGLVVMGIIILIISSTDKSGAAGVLAALPHPAAKAVGTAAALGGK